MLRSTMIRKRTRRGKGSSHEEGFTLIELLVVLAILGLIVTLVGPSIMSAFERSKAKTAAIQQSQIAVALDLFRLDVGRYPNDDEGLAVLQNAPEGIAVWNGPYLASSDALRDPWGNPYVYRRADGPSAYQIVSLGADGKAGGDGEDKDIVFSSQ